MFNKQNFCHVASNNRNEQKAGLFVYKTTDSLSTVLASGYFNEKIVDINLHDLIIHEWHDHADRTKVQRNILCVVERTLENVGTALIKSKWEGDIEQDIADLQTYVDQTFVRKDGTSIMTGPLKFRAGSFEGAIAGGLGDGIGIYKLKADGSIDSEVASLTKTNGFVSGTNNAMDIGSSSLQWKNLYIAGKVYAPIINNGVDLTVPTPAQADKLALKSEVDTAANSGSQLTNKGVWYAKMYAATVVPTGAEYDGRNYADFSQTDINGDPIIVLYEGQSGVWVQTQTITPPTDYNGYVTITSKIWDIAEQNGQQGGLVLWAFNTKTFTPYPKIISFEDAHLTGDSTVVMPATPSGTSIVNVDYLTTHTGSGKNVGDIFFTMRTDSELSGAVECDGDYYDTTDFVGAGSISALLEAGKIPYVSLATYATLLSTNGSVGVFGWDGAGNTTFRVPSLNDIFIETGTAAQIGDYIEPSAPNITAFISDVHRQAAGTVTGAFTTSNPGPVRYTQTSSGMDVQPFDVTFSAGDSSSVYKNSATTIQPNTVRYRAMVQLATGATDEALETCTQVLADVASLKTHDVIEFQAPTAQNNYTWYRKYRDGWVEQGGQHVPATSSDIDHASNQITLPVTMADTNYSILTSQVAPSVGTEFWDHTTLARRASTTTIGVCFFGTTGPNTTIQWKVEGMYAQ